MAASLEEIRKYAKDNNTTPQEASKALNGGSIPGASTTTPALGDSSTTPSGGTITKDGIVTPAPNTTSTPGVTEPSAVVTEAATPVVTTTTPEKTTTTNPSSTAVNTATDTIIGNAKADTEIDKNQMTAEATQAQADFEAKKRLDEERMREMDIETRQQNALRDQRAYEDAQSMGVIQQKEKATMEAEQASLAAGNRSRERELEIANDVQLQKNNVLFAKLGLTLSTAAVGTATQIYVTGAYKLAELKSDNAYKESTLREKVAKTEFEHTAAINKVIRDSQDEGYKAQSKLKDDIYKTKNSILVGSKEKNDRINKAIDEFQANRNKNEETVVKAIENRNSILDKEISSYYSNLKLQETYAQDKINNLVTSGKWYAIPYSQRAIYEKQAGLPTGTINKQVESTISTGIYKVAEEISGIKGLSFSRSDYSSMTKEIFELVNSGIPMSKAMNEVISGYISKSEKYQLAIQKAKKDAAPKSSGGGSGSATSGSKAYGTSSLVSFEKGGKVMSGNYVPGKGGVAGYVEADGVQYPMGEVSKVTTQTNPINVKVNGLDLLTDEELTN